VRRSGKSYAHPFLVLYTLKSSHPVTRVGVTAGRIVGNAVQRNRAKRLLRSAMSEFLPNMGPSTDMILIARTPLATSTLDQTRNALARLLKRAGLIPTSHDD
jgi:ribonuclease P protein component